MIVPMKKATILFETGDAEATVKYLRQLGVLQVEHQNLPGGDISAFQEKVVVINSAFDVLNQVTTSERNISTAEKIDGDWIAVEHHIIELGKFQEQLESITLYLVKSMSGSAGAMLIQTRYNT